MKEYSAHVDFYADHWWSVFSSLVPAAKWGDKEAAEKYLEKYWLTLAEYEKVWKPIQDQIFINQNLGLPNMVFADAYALIALRGGFLLNKQDYKQLQECMLAVGSKYFVVIENTFGMELDEPPFRLKFPASTSWAELVSGNYISAVFSEMFHREYFLFTENDSWGRYTASEYVSPIDIIGFKPEHSSLFQRVLKVSAREKKEIYSNWIPHAYQDRVI